MSSAVSADLWLKQSVSKNCCFVLLFVVVVRTHLEHELRRERDQRLRPGASSGPPGSALRDRKPLDRIQVSVALKERAQVDPGLTGLSSIRL